QIIAELMEYYDGWIRRVGSTIQVGAWEKGTITSHATLTDDDLLAEPALEPQGWGPTMNEGTVIYKAKAHHYNDYTQVYRDPNNFRITGGPRQITFNRPWITNLGIAKAYARTMGQAVSMPLTRGTLEVKREWITNNNILPGWVFTYNSGFYGLSFLMRLLEIEYGSDDSAKATLTVEWERSKWPSIYVPPGFEGPGGFELGPRALWVSVLTEVTYIMTDPDFVTQVVPLAVRGNVEVQGFRTWLSFDNGATYDLFPPDGSTSQFGSLGILYANIGAADSSFQAHLYGIDLDEIVTQTPSQQLDDTLYALIDSEVMSVG